MVKFWTDHLSLEDIPYFLYCKVQYSVNRKQILYGQTHAENKQFVVEDLHGDVLILR